MQWVLIGTLAGSLIASQHDNKEACEGRAVTLREKGAAVKCVEAPQNLSGITHGGVIRFCSGTTCSQ